MGVNVTLHPFLNNGTELNLVVEGNTVGECIDSILQQYPHMEKKLFDKKNKLKGYIEVLVNGKSTGKEELNYPVKNGDSLAVLVFLAGG
ncbi:MAG: MoaD/ThiS family protein [Syntrophorhabdaceae bacterium]|nr:MoaD/ThiS family protein [Syntrophorhabdaceae bacterium]